MLCKSYQCGPTVQHTHTHLSHKHVGSWRVGCRDVRFDEQVNTPADVAQRDVPLAIYYMRLLELKCTQGQVGDSPAPWVRRLDLVCKGTPCVGSSHSNSCQSAHIVVEGTELSTSATLLPAEHTHTHRCHHHQNHITIPDHLPHLVAHAYHRRHHHHNPKTVLTSCIVPASHQVDAI